MHCLVSLISIRVQLLHKANCHLPKPVAVQGVADADLAAGRCLASLESAGSHVCGKSHADFTRGKVADPGEDIFL